MLTKRLGTLLVVVCALLSTPRLLAHPMGNFSVNHYSKISLQKDRIRIQYIIDLAEIPTFQELQQGGISATPGDVAVKRYVVQRGVELGHGLTLSLDGEPSPLRLKSSDVIFPPGAGGLPTMKMGFVYEVPYLSGVKREHVTLHFADGNYPGHAGWKEIIAVAPTGSINNSTVASVDRSAELTNYPTDLLSSPPQNLEASLEVSLPAEIPPTASVNPVPSEAAPRGLNRAASERSPHAASGATTPQDVRPSISTPVLSYGERSMEQAAPSTVLKPNVQGTPRNKFTDLITAQRLSFWFLFTSAFLAMGLGALHALEPGHGKTIVAAYLVGSRGTARHAALLGLVVTLSHTAGVFALGAITLFASRYIVPEQLYPWLGVVSGVTVAGLGCYLFLRRLTGAVSDHSHADGSSSSHWPFARRNTGSRGAISPGPGDAGEQGPARKGTSLTQLLTLGITGGIVPCPAALIVLLSAFALHRAALGFFLIVAFSFGLAAVLVTFGLLMVYARRVMSRLEMDGPVIRRWLPLASSACITALGVGVVIQGLRGTGLNASLFSQERLGPVLFVTGLGLILGMRHSTDADHVVAISTIVSKQRSIRNAAVIGSVWGLGHTISIFAVGSLIILFKVQIPPRVGLSMEFSVAIMLILLGILNLSGLMRKVTGRWMPATMPAAGVLLISAEERHDATVQRAGRFRLYQWLRPLVVGLVHGLAGSAAVALLVLSTIHDPLKATIYLLIFGIGTMIGMMSMTATMAIPLAYAGDRFSQLSRYLGIASGVVSVCFGSFLVYQLGYLGGLFASQPHWTPK